VDWRIVLEGTFTESFSFVPTSAVEAPGAHVCAAVSALLRCLAHAGTDILADVATCTASQPELRGDGVIALEGAQKAWWYDGGSERLRSFEAASVKTLFSAIRRGLPS